MTSYLVECSEMCQTSHPDSQATYVYPANKISRYSNFKSLSENNSSRRSGICVNNMGEIFSKIFVLFLCNFFGTWNNESALVVTGRSNHDAHANAVHPATENPCFSVDANHVRHF